MELSLEILNQSKNSMKYHLHLKHKDFPEHNEWWEVVDDHIEVTSICYFNYPKKGKYVLTNIEALRQYALLTSEGWYVVDYKEQWHEFVENISVTN